MPVPWKNLDPPLRLPPYLERMGGAASHRRYRPDRRNGMLSDFLLSGLGVLLAERYLQSLTAHSVASRLSSIHFGDNPVATNRDLWTVATPFKRHYVADLALAPRELCIEAPPVLPRKSLKRIITVELCVPIIR